MGESPFITTILILCAIEGSHLDKDNDRRVPLLSGNVQLAAQGFLCNVSTFVSKYQLEK